MILNNKFASLFIIILNRDMSTIRMIFILLIFNTISIFGRAQGPAYQVKGTLQDDPGGFPVAYELVTLTSTGNRVLTDENGHFIFNVPATGNYSVEAGGMNYKPLTLKDIEVTLDNPVKDIGAVKMVQKELMLPSTTILSGMSTATSGMVISQEQLQQKQPIGTEEMLKTVPAVIIAGDMGISNRLNVGIRGSYPRRSGKILLMEDGIPIAPAPYLSPEAYYNPPAERLDGIEVIKGSSLVAYGPQTIYGAVNYLTRKPTAKPRLLVQLAGGENEYGSAFVSYGGTWNHTGAEIQLLRKHFGGFQDHTASDIYNVTGKLLTFLNPKSSLYAKINLHHEISQATYSGLTPLTFNRDPRQNPFDADILNTQRYALDMKHNYLVNDYIVVSSTVYGNSFKRDWWRQNTTLIKASDALTYLGEDIFNDRYAYLSDGSFTSDDFVRVGKIGGGRESTLSRNRTFGVAGWNEEVTVKWGKEHKQNFAGGMRLHAETFLNQEFANDSSRFGSAGAPVEDDFFTVIAGSAFVSNEFTVGKWAFTPALRGEFVRMTKFEQLDASRDPDYDPSSDEYRSINTFPILLPGMSVRFKAWKNEAKGSSLDFFASAYRGYTPPTNEVGFNAVNEEGIVTPSDDNALINMKPETSLNHEAGVNVALCNALGFQGVWFMQDIQNFYAAGRREAFETLGRVNVYGTEFSATWNLSQSFAIKNHELKLGAAGSFMHSTIVSGNVKDTDLLKAKHTSETKDEIAAKINESPGGFQVFFAAADGSDSLVSRPFVGSDVSLFKSVNLVMGKGALENQRAPYIPTFMVSAWLNYEFRNFNAGFTFTYVGDQMTDYLNLTAETADGAMGMLPAYHTIDANAGYTFNLGKSRKLTIFLAGKNLENKVYRASRLHRVSSGIMPGGFRQVNGGLTLEF
jgi:Fe(3+) dicitrate transport protein